MMSARAREFIDFWTENSVHPVEPLRTAGASQDVAELTRRCIEAEADLQAEIGDIAEHIRGKLKAANTAESGRRT